jgi:hypothetical protein
MEVYVIVSAVECGKRVEILVLNAKQSSLDIKSQKLPFP